MSKFHFSSNTVVLQSWSVLAYTSYSTDLENICVWHRSLQKNPHHNHLNMFSMNKVVKMIIPSNSTYHITIATSIQITAITYFSKFMQPYSIYIQMEGRLARL